MKRWLWWVVALAAVFLAGKLPFSGTDVAKLQPVRLIRVSVADGELLVSTDTGDMGKGTGLEEAFADMKKTSSGEIFLETADHLLVDPALQGLLPELAAYLRPGCGVCIAYKAHDLEAAAEYLAAHPSDVTLGDCRAEKKRPPLLIAREGRMELVQGKS